jgi:hypothetical protein
MSDKLGFLEGPAPVEVDAAPATAMLAEDRSPLSAESGRVRDEQGRFAASTVTPNAPARGETPAPQPPEPGHVPISALLDEREKRQAEKAAREALERQVEQMRLAREPRHQLTRDQQLEMAVYNQNLRASRRFAEREHGKDTIAAVHDWAARRCDEDPHFNAQMRASEDPYEAALQAYHREQILRTVKPNDLAAFKAWQAAQAAAGQYPAHSSARSMSVPRSLATASGTGGAGRPHVPTGPGQAFASAIPR